MDLLKTLLVYMTLLSTLSVQEGPLPQEVPTPTPLPPTVTATLVPFQTEVPTPSPTPTPPPVELLPASSRYTTLRYQDRGNNVRKLQRRLIALGYMPAGSDDGAYGYQTYNAVRDFQAMNGLDADGVAGPATLTNIYDNPKILPYATATPAPTDEPEATLPLLVTMTPAPDQTPAPQQPVAPQPVLSLTEIPEPLIISGVTGEALAMTATVDGATVRVRPSLWQNEQGSAVLSLHELADCMNGWSLGGSSVDGLYVLRAAGYEVQIHCAPAGTTVTVDGKPVVVGAADIQLYNGELYVTAGFLEKVFGATTVYDAEEHSLVLFILDKRLTQSND